MTNRLKTALVAMALVFLGSCAGWVATPTSGSVAISVGNSYPVGRPYYYRTIPPTPRPYYPSIPDIVRPVKVPSMIGPLPNRDNRHPNNSRPQKPLRPPRR